MRRLFVLLLILLVPFQATWAVSARYCEHEAEQVVSSHFGHHKHVHMGEDVEQADGGWSHADCMVCHLVASHAVFPVLSLAPAGSVTVALTAPANWLPLSGPVSQPERPQWPPLV
ncbi:hypothetical protein EV675_2620 [Pigmentiphaga kullae]|uniref:Cobalt-zinc-cadmium efflux system protein n=1 Tax=Pigmentiphaga kullae TaxID=151784 RepID=A0A4Q7NN51_9BURK|nr:hypothetical protein EV675_2620 [Pigmentiphaga kullae]